MTQSDVIECIKALSRIEAYTMSYEGMKRSHPLYNSIDLIMEKLQAELPDREAERQAQMDLISALSSAKVSS